MTQLQTPGGQLHGVGGGDRPVSAAVLRGGQAAAIDDYATPPINAANSRRVPWRFYKDYPVGGIGVNGVTNPGAAITIQKCIAGYVIFITTFDILVFNASAGPVVWHIESGFDSSRHATGIAEPNKRVWSESYDNTITPTPDIHVGFHRDFAPLQLDVGDDFILRQIASNLFNRIILQCDGYMIETGSSS